MISTHRRDLLKTAGAIGGLALIRPAIIASHVIEDARAAPPIALANAVRFVQATLNSAGTAITKLGTVILADANALNMPLYATRLFFSTAYQLDHYMKSDYPGMFPFIGMTNSAGTFGFHISLIPPNPVIPGSTGNNPSLQIFIANNAQYTNFVSYVIPNFTKPDGMPHTMQVSVGILPGSSPPRWMITAADVNQENFAISMNQGYFTGPYGGGLQPSQIPPPAFNIPMRYTGLANNDQPVLWLGQMVKSRVANYGPINSGFNNFYLTTPGIFTQTYFNPTPTQNVNLGVTIPQFVQPPNNIVGNLITSMGNVSFTALTAEDIVNQILSGINTSQFYGVATTLTNQIKTATASIQNFASLAGLSVSIQSQFAQARAAANNAGAALSGQNPSGAAFNLAQVQNSLAAAQAAISSSSGGGGIATSIPLNVNTNAAITTSVGNASSSAGTVYLSGNGTTTTNVATGTVVAASGGSYLQNQVDGGISLGTPSNYTPAQQAPTDPYMTITSIGITPEVP